MSESGETAKRRLGAFTVVPTDAQRQSPILTHSLTHSLTHIRRSSFAVRSSFVVRRSPFVVRCSPFVVRRCRRSAAASPRSTILSLSRYRCLCWRRTSVVLSERWEMLPRRWLVWRVGRQASDTRIVAAWMQSAPSWMLSVNCLDRLNGTTCFVQHGAGPWCRTRRERCCWSRRLPLFPNGGTGEGYQSFRFWLHFSFSFVRVWRCSLLLYFL